MRVLLILLSALCVWSQSTGNETNCTTVPEFVYHANELNIEAGTCANLFGSGTGTLNSYPSGYKCVLKCSGGSTLRNGTLDVWCFNGTWANLTAVCEKDPNTTSTTGPSTTSTPATTTVAPPASEGENCTDPSASPTIPPVYCKPDLVCINRKCVRVTTTTKAPDSTTASPNSTVTTTKVPDSTTASPNNTVTTTKVPESTTASPSNNDTVTTTKVPESTTTSPNNNVTTTKVPESTTASPNVTTTKVPESTTASPNNPTTTKAPDNNGTFAPTTTKVPDNNTTVAPTTTKVPDNNTTFAPTTTRVPDNNTTAAPTTTKVPDNNTTVAPTTTKVPDNNTTVAPTTTKVPDNNTTAAPTTTKVPDNNTTVAPTTTKVPDNNTTVAPTTTKVPDNNVTTTRPPSTNDTTTKVPESTTTRIDVTTTKVPTTNDTTTTKVPESTTTRVDPTTTKVPTNNDTTQVPTNNVTTTRIDVTTTKVPTTNDTTQVPTNNVTTTRIDGTTTKVPTNNGTTTRIDVTTTKVPTNNDTTTRVDVTTTKVPTNPTTTRSDVTTTKVDGTTTTARPVTTTKAPEGGYCTGEINGAIIPYYCQDGLKCVNNTCKRVDPTTTSSPSPTTTPPPAGLLNQSCTTDRPCLDPLVCIYKTSNTVGTCQIPPPATQPPIKVAEPGGRCGGNTYYRCPDGYVCVALRNSSLDSATTLVQTNVDLVGGYCVPKDVPPVVCKPGQQPVPNATTGAIRCVPCPWGTYSPKGLACQRCPIGYYTPILQTFAPTDQGPIQCEVCPRDYVADPNCAPTPTCPNCDTTSKYCTYVDATNTTFSVVPLPICKPRTCPICIATQFCYNGECRPLPTLPDSDKTTVLQTNAQDLANAGVDVSQTTDIRDTIPDTGNLDGTPTVVTTNSARTTTSVDATLLIRDANFITTNAIIEDAPVVLNGNTQAQFENYNVVSKQDGTPTTARIVAQPTDNGTPKIDIDNLNLGVNSATISGRADVFIGGTTGADGSTLYLSGPKVSGIVNTPIVITETADTPKSIDIDRTLILTAAVKGGNDAVVRVNKGGDLHAPNSTIDTSVKVDGSANFGNTSIKGTVDVTGTVRINTTNDKPPHFGIFNSCDGGVIYYNIPRSCKDIGGAKGTLFTASALSSKFACTIVITGLDCEIKLNVKWTHLGNARRLLGAATTNGGADCNQAELNTTSALYYLCNTHSSASHTSLSSLVVLMTIFLAFVLKF